ncbi:MAG: hypothetical protein ACXAAR_01485 [Candidatus Thorarchaeota archaeon]
MEKRRRIVYSGLVFILLLIVMSIPVVSSWQHAESNLQLKSVSPQETPGIIWERSFGGPQWDSCYDLIMVSTGGYALTGYTDSPWASQEGKIWLVRLDSEGEPLWNQTYRYVGDPEQSMGYSLLECTDGGFAIAGDFGVYDSGTNSYRFETLLVRTDSDGNQLWNKTYGQGIFEDMVQCPDGGFALFGFTERVGVIGNDDFYLARTDSEGNLLWNYTYGGTEADLSSRQGLVLCSDGGFAMLGGSFSFGPEIGSTTEILLVRTDSSGNLQWYQTYGGLGYNHGYCLLETDRGFIIAGTSQALGPWIIHTDAEGTVTADHEYISYALWHRTSGFGTAASMVRCSNGGYAIAGSGGGLTPDQVGGWLLRIDDSGHYLWDQLYSRSERDGLWAIVESSQGGFVLAGTTARDWEANDVDVWLIRVADQPTVPAYRLAAIALGVGFAIILGVFVIRRRERWPGL